MPRIVPGDDNRRGIVRPWMAEQLDYVYETLSRLSDIRGSQGNRTFVGSAGTFFAKEKDLELNVKIIGNTLNASGHYEYQWRIVYLNTEGVVTELPVDTPYNALSSLPAYERNNTLVANNTIVLLTPGWGEWMEFSHCCGVTTTTTPAPTTTVFPTTSTTTTNAPCVGLCKYVWTASGWLQISSNCSAGCSCLKPFFCGTIIGESTYTYCSTVVNQGTQGCGCTTTTTTTFAPCTGKCTYKCNGYGYGDLIHSNCSGSACLCATGGVGCPGVCGDIFYLNCQGTLIHDIERPCTGQCKWVYNETLGVWALLSDTCDLDVALCRCQPPSLPSIDCAIEYTPCFVPNECRSATTTSNPLRCDGRCTYRCSSGSWSLISSVDCNSNICTCAGTPVLPCNSANQGTIMTRPCTNATTTVPPTTTTATPSSTTCAPTSAPVPTCGTCVMQWVGSGGTGYWVTVTNSCSGACICQPPNFAGDGACFASIETICAARCTTTACVTTTLPNACGTCTYVHIQTVGVVDTCVADSWQLYSNSCGPNCSCFAPSCPPGAADTYMTTNCSGSGTTTSTTTTSTTTAAPTCCLNGVSPAELYFQIAGANCQDLDGYYRLGRVSDCVYSGGNGKEGISAYIQRTTESILLTITNNQGSDVGYSGSSSTTTCCSNTLTTHQYGVCTDNVPSILVTASGC